MNETLNTGVIRVGEFYEAYISHKINGKSIWHKFSGIIRLTQEDAKIDCNVLREDYLAINKI